MDSKQLSDFTLTGGLNRRRGDRLPGVDLDFRLNFRIQDCSDAILGVGIPMGNLDSMRTLGVRWEVIAVRELP